MSDADALLAAVLADPDADLPRLVYADWLEERAEAERAEFIRVQIELARDRGADPRRAVELRTREMNSLLAHGQRWLGPLEDFTLVDGFRRGFVEVVLMPARLFLREADRLFRLAPVRELHVTEASWLDLGELVGSAAFGRLAGLDLSDRRLGEQAVGMFAKVKAVRSLRVLRLRGCHLTDRAARELTATPHPWPLRELDVSWNPLSAAGLAALRERFGAAVRFDGA